ncbi:SRPBCC family protein [Pelomicrobium sp.]|uniref:SRPBCC family protein n=1 Tax=Pelomicrobium sp. TaxID=2815319 RepID=UPI002FDDD0C3
MAADELQVSRDGETISIRGQLDLPVPPQIAWATLTDYARFVDFVPDITYSRLLPDSVHDTRRLELRGENRVVFFRAEYRAVLALQEQVGERIRFRAVSGNFRELEGEWHLSSNGAGTRIAYYARLVPDFWVPPLIGPLLIRYNVRRQLEGMVREMERRAGAGSRRPGVRGWGYGRMHRPQGAARAVARSGKRRLPHESAKRGRGVAVSALMSMSNTAARTSSRRFTVSTPGSLWGKALPAVHGGALPVSPPSGNQ